MIERIPGLSQGAIPIGFVEFPCSACNRPTVFREAGAEVTCSTCRREQAEKAVADLRDSIASLADGDGPFAALSRKERYAAIREIRRDVEAFVPMRDDQEPERWDGCE